MLSIKDLLKTSVLSKRWCNLWGLRRDHYFDIFNVLGNTEEELLQAGYLIDVLRRSFVDYRDTMERLLKLDMSRDEFVKRVDRFVNNFPGINIDSFLVNFYLDHEQSNIIDQWISFVIARGVKRINLLFLGRPYPYVPSLGFDARLAALRNRYKFDFAIFSKSNASTLNHLCLQNCLVFYPINCDFIPLKDLRSLSLELVELDETFIESLMSNCTRLEELCLLNCEFKSSIPKIVSSSLCHLKIRGSFIMCNSMEDNYYARLNLNLIFLDCLKLTSLEVDGLKFTSSEYGLYTLNFNTPMLKNIAFTLSRKEDVNTFVALSATLFPKLEVIQVTTRFTVSHLSVGSVIIFVMHFFIF